MSVLRAFAAAAPFVIIAAACGPNPVGVDACRSIEDARCEVAASCGVQTQVDECKLFYRDQCLHGLDTKDAPSSKQVDDCVASIRGAGACAAKDSKTPIASCTVTPALAAAPGAKLDTVCDVVLTPENAAACAFLQPVAQDAGTDSGTTDAASDANSGGG